MAISPLEPLLFAANYVLTSSFVLALQRVWRGCGVNLPQAIWFTSAKWRIARHLSRNLVERTIFGPFPIVAPRLLLWQKCLKARR
jgi:hypothetical protein